MVMAFPSMSMKYSKSFETLPENILGHQTGHNGTLIRSSVKSKVGALGSECEDSRASMIKPTVLV